MKKRDTKLIDEIETNALDSKVPLSDTMRKLIALGGQSGSSQLRDWAALELNGYYGTDVPLPGYRKVFGAIRIDGVTMRAIVRRQQIGAHTLPDPVDKHITEEVELNGPVREIESMLVRAEASEDGDVMLALPESQKVVALMNYERSDPSQQVTAVYWTVSQVALEGVVDQIRTTLVSLIAEMRAAMPEAAVTPSAEAADQAVNVIIRGGKRHTINVAQAQARESIAPDVHATANEKERRSLWKTIGAALVGLATIVGALVAIAAWQGWSPF